MNNDLNFSVDVDSPIAVYVQVINQVQFAIVSGKIKPGDSLPAVLKMGTRLGVNVNTVTKAYRDLVLCGVLNSRRGVGVSVAEKAPKLCRDRVRPMVKHHLVDAVAECLACGVSKTEIKNIVNKSISSGRSPYESAKKK